MTTPTPPRDVLLPCPFCGETPTTANIRADENQGTKWGGVVCDCGVVGPEVRTGYMPVQEWADDAIEAWNTRADRLERLSASEATGGEPIAEISVSAHGDGGAVAETVHVLPIGGKWPRHPMTYSLSHLHGTKLYVTPPPLAVDDSRNLHRNRVDDSAYLHIADDLIAAADKLDETRSGGDEVAIQCVEQLRRHAASFAAIQPRNAVIEECAKVCDEIVMYEGEDNPAELCARYIRNLKNNANEQT